MVAMLWPSGDETPPFRERILETSKFIVGSSCQLSISRVNNKEGKRVLNALYAPYKMFSENHTPEIKILTNESARLKL
jgi:hypothetical protein